LHAYTVQYYYCTVYACKTGVPDGSVEVQRYRRLPEPTAEVPPGDEDRSRGIGCFYQQLVMRTTFSAITNTVKLSIHGTPQVGLPINLISDRCGPLSGIAPTGLMNLTPSLIAPSQAQDARNTVHPYTYAPASVF
jgi:hypothetical protein